MLSSGPVAGAGQTWWRWLPVVLAALAVAACGTSTPRSTGSENYDISVDFLKLTHGQCTAVSSFSNRYPEPLRVSGDIRFLDGSGKRVSNVVLVTDTLRPGESSRKDLSLMQILGNDDLARCRSIASYRVKVSLCRTATGKYLDSGSCIGEFGDTLTW